MGYNTRASIRRTQLQRWRRLCQIYINTGDGPGRCITHFLVPLLVEWRYRIICIWTTVRRRCFSKPVRFAVRYFLTLYSTRPSMKRLMVGGRRKLHGLRILWRFVNCLDLTKSQPKLVVLYMIRTLSGSLSGGSMVISLLCIGIPCSGMLTDISGEISVRPTVFVATIEPSLCRGGAALTGNGMYPAGE